MKPEICGECGARLEPPAQQTNTTMPTTDHEDSRKAFEAAFSQYNHNRTPAYGHYESQDEDDDWLAWRAALDWRDSQVCEWRPAVLWPFQKPGCGAEIQEERSLTQYPFCPACGRRVKIQPTTTTEDHD